MPEAQKRWRPPLSDLVNSPLRTLFDTKLLHAALITTAISPLSPFLSARLVRSYGVFGDIISARILFEGIPNRTIFLWNAIIRAHCRCRDISTAFRLFNSMRKSSSRQQPDVRTFACILCACSENSDPLVAGTIHGSTISKGFSKHPIVSSSLVNVYSKLGLMSDAARLFDEITNPDLVLWNSMITACGYGGDPLGGLRLFRRLQFSSENPDGYTLVGLASCLRNPDGSRSGICIGQIHGFSLKSGFDSNFFVGSSLIKLYSCHHYMDSAYKLFLNSSYEVDLVIWSAIITGFSQVGEVDKALMLFREMIFTGKRPDSVLIATILSACSTLTLAHCCKEIHGLVFRLEIQQAMKVRCALIDSYAKCGHVFLSFRVFKMLQNTSSVVLYNTIISSMGSHGRGKEAIEFFEDMLSHGFQPDSATFSALLCSCCHLSLAENGLSFFALMRDDFRIEPQVEHYVYLVKLLGMLGKLEEAYRVVLQMPIPPDSGVWGALLWGCSVHGFAHLGQIAARKLFYLEPKKAAYRVMLGNIYASHENWSEVKSLRNEIGGYTLLKVPGLSWIEDSRV